MTERQLDQRWDAILRMLESMASLDFTRSLAISDKADHMDAVASGLNMLSEELQANVVARSKLEETVEELQWYKSMVTGSSDLMVYLDSTYTYRAVNQAYCLEHLRTQKEILGHTVAEVFGETVFQATLKPQLDRCLSGEQVTFEFWWDSPSRGRRHVEARYDPFFGDDGSVLGVVMDARDTTERKRSEQQQEQSVTALEAANRELELFSASLAHDLRSPLLIVTNFSAHLAEQLGDSLDAKPKDDLQRIRAAGRHMMHILEDLRDLTDVTRSELTREKVDISSLGREIIDELSALVPDRDVKLVAEPGLMAVGDKTLLRLLLSNLLQNSWKYTGPSDNARIELGVRHDKDGGPIYYVRDNGIGFDNANSDLIFRPFERLHTRGEFPGSGLGLATVERIVRRHGGRVWAEGKVGEGSLFSFTLAPPLADRRRRPRPGAERPSREDS